MACFMIFIIYLTVKIFAGIVHFVLWITFLPFKIFSAILFPHKTADKIERKRDLEDAYWEGFFDGSHYWF